MDAWIMTHYTTHENTVGHLRDLAHDLNEELAELTADLENDAMLFISDYARELITNSITTLSEKIADINVALYLSGKHQ